MSGENIRLLAQLYARAPMGGTHAPRATRTTENVCCPRRAHPHATIAEMTHHIRARMQPWRICESH